MTDNHEHLISVLQKYDKFSSQKGSAHQTQGKIVRSHAQYKIHDQTFARRRATRENLRSIGAMLVLFAYEMAVSFKTETKTPRKHVLICVYQRCDL